MQTKIKKKAEPKEFSVEAAVQVLQKAEQEKRDACLAEVLAVLEKHGYELQIHIPTPQHVLVPKAPKAQTQKPQGA